MTKLFRAGLAGFLSLSLLSSSSFAGVRSFAETGSNDNRITNVGPDSNASFNAFTGDIVFNSRDNRYLVVYYADDTNFGLADNESEIFGQFLNPDGTALGSPFRISDMGPDGNANFDAVAPEAAYNSVNNEYMVIWYGDDNTGSLVDGENEVYAQRLDSTGAQIGANDFRVSQAGPDGNTAFAAFTGGVAFNPDRNEYLIIWQADDNTGSLVAGEFEVYARLYDGSGTALGAAFRVSQQGADGLAGIDADIPEVVYNTVNQEYLIAWRGDFPDAGEAELFVQRVSPQGALVGSPLRASTMGPENDASYAVRDIGLAFNARDNEYLAVWSADDNTGTLVESEFEIFGQRLSASLEEIGADDFRISQMGPDGSTAYLADNCDAVWNSRTNEYFVVWRSDDNTGSLVDDEFEIFGQVVQANGTTTPGSHQRLSDMGTDGSTAAAAEGPSVAYNETLFQTMTIWYGDDPGGQTADNENEIFAQASQDGTPTSLQSSPAGLISYPNPFQPSRGHSLITFDNQPAGSTIKIYTLTGELVRELTADSTGRAQWDARNKSGEQTASGVYLAVSEGGGSTEVIKVAIER